MKILVETVGSAAVAVAVVAVAGLAFCLGAQWLWLAVKFGLAAAGGAAIACWSFTASQGDD
jgi:hypothetical protein